MNGKNTTGNLNQGGNLGAGASIPPVFPGVLAPKKKKGKKIVLGVIIGLAVVAAGAVIVLAAGFWDPVWNPFRESPDKVLEQAFDNMMALKTLRFKMVIVLDGRVNDEIFKARVIMEGDSDDSDANNSKMQLTLDLSVFAEGVEMLFAGEARQLDDVTYFKIKTIPIALYSSLAAIGINLEDWRDKWFKWDIQELGMSFGLGSLSQEEEAAMGKEVKDLLAKYPILKAKKRLAEQEIDGQKTYHYLADVDKENLKPFLAGVVEILNKYYQSGSIAQITSAEKEEMFQKIDEAFEAFGEITFEIWIGKKDKLIYKIAGQKLIDISKMEMEEGEQGELDIKFEMVNSKFNQPVIIEAPADSKSIIEMLMPFFQAYMEEGAGFPAQ